VAEFAACGARCDDIVCSSDVGTLKSENPHAFFGPWLARSGLTFADAVLIDDRTDNCEAFAAQGGQALQWKLGTNPLSDLKAGLHGWFASTSSPSLTTAAPPCPF
jgi:FMN phosphatase YigB (HAD superfamily)